MQLITYEESLIKFPALKNKITGGSWSWEGQTIFINGIPSGFQRSPYQFLEVEINNKHCFRFKKEVATGEITLIGHTIYYYE